MAESAAAAAGVVDAVAQQQHRLPLRPVFLQRVGQRRRQVGRLAAGLLVGELLRRHRGRLAGEAAQADLIRFVQFPGDPLGNAAGRRVAAFTVGGVTGGHARRTVDQDRQQRFARRGRNPLLPGWIQQNHERDRRGECHQRRDHRPPPRHQAATAGDAVGDQHRRRQQRQRHPKGQRNVRIESDARHVFRR